MTLLPCFLGAEPNSAGVPGGTAWLTALTAGPDPEPRPFIRSSLPTHMAFHTPAVPMCHRWPVNPGPPTDWPRVPGISLPRPTSISLMVKWGDTYFAGERMNRNGESRKRGTWGGAMSQGVPERVRVLALAGPAWTNHLGDAETPMRRKRGVIREGCLPGGA